ncbi:hypothetical protein HPY01_14950, partial [Lactobacillus rhamnosus]|nr:hypothetical protein [Lacticaseibacillus rhamnosus]
GGGGGGGGGGGAGVARRGNKETEPKVETAMEGGLGSLGLLGGAGRRNV